MKKMLFAALLALSVAISGFAFVSEVYAQVIVIEYKVYSEEGEYLTILPTPSLNDFYITGDNRLFKIIEIKHDTAVAKFIDYIIPPKIKNAPDIVFTSIVFAKKNIGIYHTHNAESYVPTDGTDSYYGKGGIHDVGKKFAEDLNNKGIDVTHDETLHLPHDTYAYTRSAVTANKLLKIDEIGALLDLHRDGIARSEYYGIINGEPGSKIRLVVGKANPKMSENLDFAIAIKALADERYPGLIKDIFLASGSYNQEKFSRAILLEMGTYLIEKPLIERTAVYMADVIDGVLYSRVVEGPSGEESYAEEVGTLTPITNTENTLPYADNPNSEEEIKNIIIALSIIGGVAVLGAGYYLLLKRKKS